MKRFGLLFLLSTAIVGSAAATTFTFTPSDHDIYDLDHHNAYSWGISTNSGSGRTLKNELRYSDKSIISATITFKDIWNWKKEDNILYVHLLEKTKIGLKSYQDNRWDDFSNGDYFAQDDSRSYSSSKPIAYSHEIFLTKWTDPVGGERSYDDFTYEFTTTQLGILEDYILSSGKYDTFGFGFDPECHYYNDGIKVVINTGYHSVPEAGVSLLLLSMGLTSLAVVRRYLRF